MFSEFCNFSEIRFFQTNQNFKTFGIRTLLLLNIYRDEVEVNIQQYTEPEVNDCCNFQRGL